MWSPEEGKVARHRQVGILEPITSFKQGHQLCIPPPKVYATVGRMQGTEGKGEGKPWASLAGATQRICHQAPRLPRLGNESIGYRERKGRGGPISAPGRGDLLHAANLRAKNQIH